MLLARFRCPLFPLIELKKNYRPLLAEMAINDTLFRQIPSGRGSMKTLGKAVIGGALLLTMFAPAGRADGTSSKNTVSWETIIGTFFIPATPPATGSSNTVGGIIGGGFPWSTLGAATPMSICPPARSTSR
jgi:hypothetical protein